MELAGDRVQSGTNWQAYDVADMWRMLESQQTDNHNRHITAWGRTVELTRTHLSRLTMFRAELAEAWPPDQRYRGVPGCCSHRCSPEVCPISHGGSRRYASDAAASAATTAVAIVPRVTMASGRAPCTAPT